MYTYGHTLSLHDALPIPAFGCLLSGHAAAGGWCAIGGHADILRGSQQRAAPPTVRGGGACHGNVDHRHALRACRAAPGHGAADRSRAARALNGRDTRSEEQTHEITPLIRT